MNLNKKILINLSIAYLYIPIALFLFSWTKLWIALVCIITVGYCVFKMSKSFCAGENEVVQIKILTFLISIFFLLAIGYFAGWGGWCSQAGDWEKHNAVMRDLTKCNWPVYYSNGSENSMLTYYIAQYLVPAFFGKIFNSFRVTEIVNYIWTEIGLILVWLNIVRLIKIKKIWQQFLSLVIFIFFSGPMCFAQFIRFLIYHQKINSLHFLVFMRGIKLQYSSNYALLRWVFPQVIAIWITMLLFLENKEKIKYYIPLMLPSLLFGTLSFAGLIPIALGVAVVVLIHKRNFIDWIKNIFSLENLLTLFSLGTILILYFSGNILSEKPSDISLQRISYGILWGLYFIFVGVMVVPYALCIWSDNKKNELFYISVGSLLIFPLFKMGLCNDLVMRCSIPSLFILMLLVIKFLNSHVNIKNFKNKKSNIKIKIAIFAVFGLLLSGGFYPFLELQSSIVDWKNNVPIKKFKVQSLEDFANRFDRNLSDDVKYNYYSYDVQTSIFYKYIARK